MIKRLVILTGILTVALAQSQTQLRREGSYWVETTGGTIPLKGTERMRVIANGPLTIRGTSENQATYTVKKSVRARNEKQARTQLESFSVATEQRGGWISVTFGGSSGERVRTEVELNVPKGLRALNCRTPGGNLSTAGLNGSLEAETGGGRIEVDEIQGSVLLRTAGGSVNLGTIGGPVKCFSGGGNIRGGTVNGEAIFETAGGDISLDAAKGPVRAATNGGNIFIRRAGSTVTANTGGGLIKVLDAAGEVMAESGGGAIKIGRASGVKCQSAGGAILLEDISGALRASTAMGSIEARLIPGHPLKDSSLRTGAGDITVFIPSDLAVTIRALNESGFGMNKIISDFPEIAVRTEEANRPSVQAQGSLNGGGPVLQLTASSGTIYLRRQR